jgi:hypothetical protein
MDGLGEDLKFVASMPVIPVMMTSEMSMSG